MRRVCKKCGEEKEIEEFVKHKTCIYGRGYTCKKCKHDLYVDYAKKYSSEYRIRRKDYFKDTNKAYKELHKEYYIEYGKKYYNNNKRKISARHGEYYRLNKDHLSKINKNYNKLNRIKINIAARLHRNSNLEKYQQQERQYVKSGIDNLSDNYIKKIISQVSDIPMRIITEHPELIENYRKQIILKRSLKLKK